MKSLAWCAAAAFALALAMMPGCISFGPPVETHSPHFDNEGKTGPEARQAADRFFRMAEAQIAGVRDITAELTRQEVLGGRMQDPETIRWVQRVDPHSLHLTWSTGKQFGGRELVYVEGANDGKVLVHMPGSIIARIQKVQKLSPDSALINQGSRYSIRDVGYETLVKRIVDNYDAAARRDTLSVVDFGLHEHEGYQTHAFEVVLDYPDKPMGDYHSMTVWFDTKTGLPVHFIGVNDNMTPVEDYLWKNLKFNQDLTDADFVIGGTAENHDDAKGKAAETAPATGAPASAKPESKGVVPGLLPPKTETKPNGSAPTTPGAATEPSVK